LTKVKYVPASNIPSTAELNSKLGNPNSSRMSSTITTPRRYMSFETTTTTTTTTTNNKQTTTHLSKPGQTDSYATRMAAKVARFGHKCGNSHTMPDIRFCCECGVKRLYC
jgi:hypothetical protein